MKHLSIIFLILFFGYKVTAQTDIRLHGNVYEEGSGELIPFVTLRIKDTHKGSITEENGSFAIRIPQVFSKGTLQFSCVGYKTKEVPIASLLENETNQIYLEVHVEPLDDVVVSNGKNEDPEKILKKAIRKIKGNYQKKKHTFDAYYRERIVENGATVKFSDAAVTFDQTGYDGKRFRQYILGPIIINSRGNGNLGIVSSIMTLGGNWGERLHDHFGHNTQREDKVKVHDSRSSLNLSTEGMEANIEGGPLSILSKDLVKYISHFLDKKNFSKYDYQLYEQLNDNNRWDYVIKFEPNEEPLSLEKIQEMQAMNKRTSRVDILSGSIFIDQETYAIKRVTYGVSQKYRRHICNLGDMNIKHYGYEIDVNYKQHNDRWQIDKITRLDEFIFKDTLKQQTTPYATITELFVTKPESSIESVLPRENFPNIDSNSLYDYAVAYDSGFWVAYEKENPLATIAPEIRADMETADALEKQFAMKHLRDESMRPPIAPLQPITTKIHGVELVDSYQWLKSTKPKGNDKVMDYINSENKYTENYLVPLRKNIRTISSEIWNVMDQASKTDPYLNYGYWYWSLYENDNEFRTIYRKKDEPNATEEVLLNLNSIADSADYFKFGFYNVSPNNQYLAYAIDTLGQGKMNTYITDLTTGKILKDSTSLAAGFLWAEDSKGFFYTLKDEKTDRSHSIMYHQLGSDFKTDSLYLFEDDKASSVSMWQSRDREFVFMASASNSTSSIYMARNRMPYQFRLLKKTQAGQHYGLYPVQDKMFVFTNEGAENGRLMVADTAAFNFDNLREVESSTEDIILEDFAVFKDYLVFLKKQRMNQYIEVKNRHTYEVYRIEGKSGELHALTLGRNDDYESDSLQYLESAPHYRTVKVSFNLKEKRESRKPLAQSQGAGLNFLYVSRLIWVEVRDGAQVPVSLVYLGNSKLKRLDQRPVLIDAYGAYGSGNQLVFDRSMNPLINNGFIYAYVHVRGGDELGRSWYKQGKKFNKLNSFNDLIDVTDYLKAEGIGHAKKMFANGGSAGGLLMAAVINQRPDLFAGAFLDVPFVDVINTMLDANLPLTVNEYEEWGDPNNKKDFQYMLQYSPYDNIKPQAYPRMMFQAALADRKVGYWEAAKMVAKLRANKTDNNILLLQTQLNEGHNLANSRLQGVQLLAQKYAILFEWLAEVNHELALAEDK